MNSVFFSFFFSYFTTFHPMCLYETETAPKNGNKKIDSFSFDYKADACVCSLFPITQLTFF